MKRSGKFYRKNEAEVMKSLGLTPTKNSGSGWIEKEDGQNEHIICQLKSTDASSISIKKLDLDKLKRNAAITHKLPVFVVQFLESQELFLMIEPKYIQEVAEYIEKGEVQTLNEFIGVDENITSELNSGPCRKIKSSEKAREQFRKEQSEKYEKKERSAT